MLPIGLVYTNTVVYSEYLLSLWQSGALVIEVSHTSPVCLRDRPPIKVMEHPWLATLCMCSHT